MKKAIEKVLARRSLFSDAVGQRIAQLIINSPEFDALSADKKQNIIYRYIDSGKETAYHL